MTSVHLRRNLFEQKERPFVDTDGIQVTLFRYETGVEAVRLASQHGYVVALPFMGQMIWDAWFEGVGLGMGSMFPAPRPAQSILDTYGCLAFHSGILRNGHPGPEDTHPVHGEMPCAPMNRAGLELGSDAEGAFVRLTGEFEYIRGFGAHYKASPTLTVRPDRTLFDIGMTVENLGGSAMDLMYGCHVNFAFVDDGRIIQPAAFTPENVTVRREAPFCGAPTPAYEALIAELARDPARLQTLDSSLAYDPAVMFYLSNLRCDAHGNTHLMLRRPEGDAFVVSYAPERFPYASRMMICKADEQVAAFALPATCRAEGYAAEKRAGRVQSLKPRGVARFSLRAGYLNPAAAEAMERMIRGL
jgi:hypothetical protein